jgi:hypothetical protein
MQDEKNLNIYDLMQASATFLNYLTDNNFDRIDASFLDKYPKGVYVKMLVTQSALLLALFKESIVTKDEDNKLSLNIFQHAFDKLMTNLYYEDGEEYKIGSLTYNSKLEVLDALRNKLLHGDYVIDTDDNTILLNHRGLKGSITVDALVESCSLLCGSHVCNLDKPNTRIMVFKNENIFDRVTDISKKTQLKSFMREVQVVKIIDKPKEGFVRTPAYVTVMNSFFLTFKNVVKFMELFRMSKVCEIVKEQHKKYFDLAHIDCNIVITPVADLPEYSKVAQYFVDNREYLDSLSIEDKRKKLVRYASNVIHANYMNYAIMMTSLTNNIRFLSAYINGEDLSKVEYMVDTSETYEDDMSIAALFNHFYCTYHYGLDEIYSNGVGTSLRGIAEGKYLDYSKLQLDDFYDPSMTIDNGFNDFDNQLERLEKGIDAYVTRKDGAEAGYKAYLEHVETPDSQRVNRLMSNLDLRINEYNKEKETIDKAKEFMDSKYDLYVRNYNIIAHIRNAFAHGNVRIMNHISGDTLNDRVILIEDNYEGKCTYRLVITYKEFRKLFSNYNTDIVYKFVSDKAMGAAINKGLVKKPE